MGETGEAVNNVQVIIVVNIMAIVNAGVKPHPIAGLSTVKVAHKERNNGNYDKVEDSGLR